MKGEPLVRPERVCMSKSMGPSTAIDPAGFIPTKVNAVHPTEEETVPPLLRKKGDKSDLLDSLFMLRLITAAEKDLNAGHSDQKLVIS